MGTQERGTPLEVITERICLALLSNLLSVLPKTGRGGKNDGVASGSDGSAAGVW